MGEIYNRTYRPIGEATYGHLVYQEFIVPTSALQLGVDFTSNDLTANFQGAAKQAFKVNPIHVGGGSPTANVTIQEFMPHPSAPNDGQAINGEWVDNAALGTGVANANEMFVHNQEDTLRLARVVLNPGGGVLPDGGIKVILTGRRDT